MGCCGSKNAPVVIRNDQGSTTPVRSRKCRDVFFLLFFIAALGGVGFVAYHSTRNGDPMRYINGVDSWGNVCGRKKNPPIIEDGNTNSSVQNSGKDRSNHFYELNLFLSDISLLLNPENILSEGNTPIVLCVSECPNDTVTDCPDLLADNGYNVKRVVINRRACQMPGKKVFAHKAILNRCVPKQLAALGQGVAQASIATADVLATTVIANKTGNEPKSLKNTPLQHVHDMILSVTDNWESITYLLLIAVGISLLTIIMLQLFTRVLVITIMVVSTLGTGAVAGYLWYHYLVTIKVIPAGTAFTAIVNLTSSTEDILGIQTNVSTDLLTTTSNLTASLSLNSLHESEYLLPITIAVTVFTLITWILLIWSRKSLKLVISLFDEASLALFSMPGILLQPFITVIALVVAFAGFLVISAFLLSDQVPHVDEDGIVTYMNEPGMKSGQLLMIPVVFVFLWLFEFIFACQEIILAGAISTWFFTRGITKISCKICPTLKPTKDLILYNLGSAAFGSLIIAIVQFFRLILAYIQKKMKNVDNKAAKCVLKCMQCCLACFEKMLKYINRNAFICIAMYGEGFCASAKKALSLLISNAQHVVALNCLSGFCLFLGKVTVVGVVGTLASAWFSEKSTSDISFLFPVIICCLGAFFIASCFMSVFGMAIDTIFLCFCDDCQRNDGNDRPYYSSQSLRKFMESASSKKQNKQPKSSAGPSSKNLRVRTRVIKSKPASRKAAASFTRINIPDKEKNLRKSYTSRDNKVYPLPGSAAEWH
ncbi:choline transporter-like protein 1 [Styela clava]